MAWQWRVLLLLKTISPVIENASKIQKLFLEQEKGVIFLGDGSGHDCRVLEKERLRGVFVTPAKFQGCIRNAKANVYSAQATLLFALRRTRIIEFRRSGAFFASGQQMFFPYAILRHFIELYSSLYASFAYPFWDTFIEGCMWSLKLWSELCCPHRVESTMKIWK